nr:nitrate- and nitrite sensing domain-containing protein [Nocardia tengchongensis]
MPRPKAGIRTRILAIALIPSVALFATGLTIAGYLLQQGENVKTWSSVLADANQQAGDMIDAIQRERLLSLMRLTTTRPDPLALGQARKRLDTALAQLTSLESALMKTTIGHMDLATNRFDAVKAQLPTVRDRIDAGTLPIADVYGVYSGLLEGVALGTQLIGRSAPDSQVAIEFANEVRVLRAAEAMSRSSTLGLVALRGAELPDALVTEYRDMVGYYRTELPQLVNDLGGERGASAKKLISTSEWQQLSAMEDFVLHWAPDKTGGRIDVRDEYLARQHRPSPESVTGAVAGAEQVCEPGRERRRGPNVAELSVRRCWSTGPRDDRLPLIAVARKSAHPSTSATARGNAGLGRGKAAGHHPAPQPRATRRHRQWSRFAGFRSRRGR